MKNVVMGTAGHVDHGKTTLVKSLTGIDTDRLEEEKRRGMTIELGFAPLVLPSGREISIIDVPGHEKFVKTMVAGVTGIDFVLLAVAADEGVMPQTREHLDILSLLEVKKGAVALTKTDLVDEAWLEMVSEEIIKALESTTLAGSPVIPVSAVSGKGMAELLEQLEKLSAEASTESGSDLFRLSVDRVFSMTGHGTVVTGTISGGVVRKGDEIELLPSGRLARVRGIQVHNKSVELASAGDRCALNLSGIEKGEIERGDTVSHPGTLKAVVLADAALQSVQGSDGISHNQRVHVHTGTREVLARVRVLGSDHIPGGSDGYVQLRFEEPVAVNRGDRFILRSYSPVTTIAGGKILYHDTHNRARFSQDTAKAMETAEQGSPKELVLEVLERSAAAQRNTAAVQGRAAMQGRAAVMMEPEAIRQQISKSSEDIGEALRALVQENKVIFLADVGKYISSKRYLALSEKITGEFEQYSRRFPYRFQMDREEMKSRVLKDADTKEFNALLVLYQDDSLLSVEGKFLAEPGNAVVERIRERKEVRDTHDAVLADGLSPRNINQLCMDLKLDLPKTEEIMRFLLKIGELVDIGNGVVIHKNVLRTAVEQIREGLADGQNGLTAAQARDQLGCGRKMAIALLEYLDERGITQREGDIRKPGVHYLSEFI